MACLGRQVGKRCLVAANPQRPATTLPLPRPLAPVRVPGRKAAQAARAGGESSSSSGVRDDPYLTAGMRLQQLVDDSAWDGGEALRQELLSLPIASRLTFIINVACVPLTLALIVNVLTNEQLLGGMSLSQDSLVHAMHGSMYALPLLATSLVGRIPRVRRSFPVLDALHDLQEKVMEPLVKGLDMPQLIIVCLTMTLPSMLFMLPAVHGSMLALGSQLQTHLLSPAQVHVPGSVGRELATLLPAMGSSYLAAFIVAKQMTVKRGQYRAIQVAITHSDKDNALLSAVDRLVVLRPLHCPLRYYRLTESMAAQDGNTGDRSREASEAFKMVSTMWVVVRKKVTQLSFILTALNVCYLAMIWHEGNDLSTPFAAAVLYFGFEMLLCRRSLLAKDRARQRLGQELESQM